MSSPKTKDVRSALGEKDRLMIQDINRLALGQTVETTTYRIVGIGTISFVTVVTAIGASQSAGGAPDTTPPAQVTGLAVSPLTSSSLGLTWNSNVESDLNHYNVYRGTVSGFTVTLGVTVPTGTSTGNSFTDTGLSASTTYYYRVSAVDNTGNIGALSTQAQGTTLAAGAIAPSLELHLNGTFNDTSSFAHTIFFSNSNGFLGSGQFGGNSWRCNFPVQPPIQPDRISPDGASPTASITMDTTVGFSWSFWINPQDISALSRKRTIVEKAEDLNNQYTIQIDSAGILYFFVKKGGTDFKRQVSGFTTGSWQHVAATFNGATNTVAVYRNAVAGIASSATPDYRLDAQITGGIDWLQIGYSIGSDFDSHYEGYFDEIRYYRSTVLTPTQVTNLMNTNAP